MALVLKDRVKETTTTTGTGTITLAGASTGYQSFSVIGNSNTTYYCIAGQGTSEWEVGIGTYTSVGTTLARTTVLASSNAGALVTFSAGTKDVFVVWPASQAQPFTYSESTTAPNATVYVDAITVNASSTNADIAIVAKGTGATLAQVPTSTATGGNKRGQYAVDFQKSRSLGLSVASGDYSFLGGGFDNATISTYTVICGGNSNYVSSSYGTVVGGTYNTASGQYGFVGGGSNNTSSNTYASVNGGFANVASTTYASILGGASNAANGSFSTILGGGYGTTRSIVGNAVIAACNAPISSGAGVSQLGILLLAVQTTDATSTVLRSNTSAATTTNQVILPNNSAYYFRGEVIAGVTGGGNTKGWFIEGAIKRGANAAATALVGTPTVTSNYADAGAAAWTVAAAADTTNGGLQITVTGAAATTIRWVCQMRTTEMTY